MDDLRITPEPTEEEREAIATALEVAAEEEAPGEGSAWRAAGLREATGREADEA